MYSARLVRRERVLLFVAVLSWVIPLALCTGGGGTLTASAQQIVSPTAMRTKTPTPRATSAAAYPAPQAAPPAPTTARSTFNATFCAAPASFALYLPFIAGGSGAGSPPASSGGLGSERYWTFQDFALSDRASVRANVWNGNVVAQYAAFAIPSRGLPLAFTLTYNSQTNTWTHNLGLFLECDITASVLVRDADGTTHFFRRSARRRAMSTTRTAIAPRWWMRSISARPTPTTRSTA